MKALKNYWFLQEPIDVEHKFYILMDFLQSVEDDINSKKYNDTVQKIRRIKEDLKAFKETRALSNRSIGIMTKEEIDNLKIIQDGIQDKEIDLESVLDNSINIIDEFILKINPVIQEINNAIKIYKHGDNTSFRDQGFLVLRIPKKRKIKVYSWMFSFVNVKKKDQVGLLITELLDPLPKYSKNDKNIIAFFEENIKIASMSVDSFIFADLEAIDGEIEFDLMKERGIQFIIESSQKDFSK